MKIKAKFEPMTSSGMTMMAANDTARERQLIFLLRSESDRVEFASALKPLENATIYMMLRPPRLGGAFLRANQKPDAILVDIDTQDQADVDYIRKLKSSVSGQGIPVVALVDRGTELAGVRAFRAGADDAIRKPLKIEEVREALARVTGASGAAPNAAKLGDLISFVHITGGAGATTLAVNSACLLSEAAANDRTCLIDLDIQYGNVGNLLDLNTNSPVQSLIDDPARLDHELLESMLIRYDSNLRVLTAPSETFPLNAYSSQLVSHLLQMAKRQFAHVIVDLPVALAPWTDEVLRESTIVYVVCTANVASVHRLAQFLRALQMEDLAQLPLRIVLNRYHANGQGSDISASQFANAVLREADHRIPEDYRLISASHSQGKPAVQIDRRGKFATHLRKMLRADLGAGILPPVERSWWAFGRAE